MTQRFIYLDIIKGISVLSIVLQHFENGIFSQNVNTWIGLFMITAFYVISGWMFGLSSKKITIRELVKKRMSSLMIPYLWFSLLILVFDSMLFLFGYYDFKLILRDIFKTIVLRGIGTLWFLPALFFGEIIFVYIRDKNKWQITIAIILTLSYMCGYDRLSANYGHQSELFRIIDAPLHTIHSIAIAWIIIAISYLISHKYASIIILLNKWKLLSISFTLLIIYTAFQQILIRLNTEFISSLSGLLLNLLGPFAIMILCMFIERFSFSKFFAFWGRNSLILMAVHYSIIQVICEILNKYWLKHPEFTGINTLYFFIATMIVMYPITYFINAKAKFLIGK